MDKSSKKYFFEEFKTKIPNVNLEVFKHNDLKLVFKSFEVVKKRDTPFEIIIDIQFLDG